MSEPHTTRRAIRRRIRRDGLDLNLAADITVVSDVNGPRATTQRSHIVQRTTRAASPTDRPEEEK